MPQETTEIFLNDARFSKEITTKNQNKGHSWLLATKVDLSILNVFWFFSDPAKNAWMAIRINRI